MGNKVDLADEQKISTEQAKQMADGHGMKYYDASAKENINIDAFMDDLIKQVYLNKFGGGKSVERPTIKLKKKDMVGQTGQQNEGTANRGCCK